MGETAFVFLVRHGEADMPDTEGRYGLDSAPLTECGVRQVRRLAEHLRAATVDSLYCSDMLRAKQSAAVIGEMIGATPIELANLREIDVGSFGGMTRPRLCAHPEFRPWIECSFDGRFPSEDFHHPADLRFPGGEDVYAMHRRALPAFLDLVRGELGRTCVFVGHAWLIQALLCHVLGAPVSQYFRFAGRNASMNLVEVDISGRGMLHLFGGSDPLAEVAAGRLVQTQGTSVRKGGRGASSGRPHKV